MFNFERLEVWQKSIGFAESVHRLSRSFPEEERYGLTIQIRRAAYSISSNLAEGSARPPADFAKFIGYASGSLFEVISQATVARNLGFLSPEAHQALYHDAEAISRMLSGLRKSLE